MLSRSSDDTASQYWSYWASGSNPAGAVTKGVRIRLFAPSIVIDFEAKKKDMEEVAGRTRERKWRTIAEGTIGMRRGQSRHSNMKRISPFGGPMRKEDTNQVSELTHLAATIGFFLLLRPLRNQFSF